MERYDVIIIGSGAGGGTLVSHLAPSGKRILLLERGDWLPREPQNWNDERCLRRQPLRLGGHLVRRKGRALPAAGPLLRRRGDQAVRRRALSPSQGGLRRAPAITTGSRPPGRSPTTSSSRTTPSPSSSYEVHGARGEDPTEPPASAPYPFPAVAHEPRIQQLADDLAAAGYQPFHAPCGVRLNAVDMAFSKCIRCHDVRRLPLPRPRQVGRRGSRRAPCARAPERHAPDGMRGPSSLRRTPRATR